MSWDEIYDRSKIVVQRVIERLLEDGETISLRKEDVMEDVVDRLQDSDYLIAELHRRERYDYRGAYQKLKHQEQRRNRLRLAILVGSAACVLVACSLFVIVWENAENTIIKLSQNEVIRPGGMRAILEKADGEEIILDQQERQLNETNGAILAIDSVGLQYKVLNSLQKDSLVYNTLTVPRGGTYRLVLADGTGIWLNSDSKLVYPVTFSRKTRKVWLTGEAYFEVEKDERKPFIVDTDLGEIKVLGTQFNVKCYPEESNVTATLVEGRVSFSNEIVEDVKLYPNDQLVFNKGDSNVNVRDVNVQHYVNWIDNQMSFQSESLESIMRMLARWYDVEVTFEDESLKELVFSGNLDKYDTIDSFFKLFELGANVRFEIQGKRIFVKSKR